MPEPPEPPRTCPTCDGCKDEPCHHWINHTPSLTGIICKHCPALGAQCSACGGHGKWQRNPKSLSLDACQVCQGAGIVEVARVDGDTARKDIAIDRLIAAAPEMLEMLKALWLEVKRCDYGHEGSQLLEVMCEALHVLDRLHGSDSWRTER